MWYGISLMLIIYKAYYLHKFARVPSVRGGCRREHGGDGGGVRQGAKAVEGVAGRAAPRTGAQFPGMTSSFNIGWVFMYYLLH